jgi:hypothetical protein
MNQCWQAGSMLCAVSGYLQPETGLQNGMAHPAARHSSGDCLTPLPVPMCLLAGTIPYLYNMPMWGRPDNIRVRFAPPALS